MRKPRFFSLFFVVMVLLLQFYLRAHHITELPFFWDENRHIVRAADILDGIHPAKQSHGKFLLYAWIAPFAPERDVALHVSRTAVALFSLLGTAGLYAGTKRLFGTVPARFAILFYITVPFTLFYERMVLADGLAAALGCLTAWQSIRLASYPTQRRAVAVGAFAALAVMAKLTMTFSVVAMPVLAALFLSENTSFSLRKLIQRYWSYWLIAGLTFVIFWLPTLIPAAISGLNGDYYVLVDQSLIDDTVLSSKDVNRFTEFLNQITTLLSIPMLTALLGMVAIGLWHIPRKTLFILAWLLLIWLPSLILVWRTQTRYLMPGIYPIAMLFGAGVFTLRNLPAYQADQPKVLTSIAASFLLLWMAVFSLPFAHKATTAAEELDMTRWDNRDYYQAPWNAYALLPSLTYLNEHGTAADDGKIHVLGVAWMCEYMDLYGFSSIDLTCLDKEYASDPTSLLWGEAQALALQTTPIYLMLEQHRNTLEIPENPFAAEGLSWTKLTAFQRPKEGLWVTVWARD